MPVLHPLSVTFSGQHLRKLWLFISFQELKNLKSESWLSKTWLQFTEHPSGARPCPGGVRHCSGQLNFEGVNSAWCGDRGNLNSLDRGLESKRMITGRGHGGGVPIDEIEEVRGTGY